MKKQSKLACTLLILCTTFAWTGCSDDDNPIRNTPTEDPTPAEPSDSDPHAGHRAEGFWIVNEDWFGHDNGTVNRFKRTGYTTLEPVYRAYRAANDEETFGVTTQFGAIWGDNFYFTSKQGNRLVVADARTLKKKAVFTEIGGDGRAFVGLTDRKAYVGHNRGVAVFDIPSLTITRQLEGISSQTGDMRLAAGKVFVVTQKEGLCVVDPVTDQVLQRIDGKFYALTRSLDGRIWVAGKDGFLVINPETMQQATRPYPDEAAIGSPWGAWRAGSLCASTHRNVLYWIGGGGMVSSGSTLYKYEVDSGTAKPVLETGQTEKGDELMFSGTGVRVDPWTDELVVTLTQSGYGVNYAYNWVCVLDADGKEVLRLPLKGDNGLGSEWSTVNKQENWDDKYFWFPALPVFEDACKPEFTADNMGLTAGHSGEFDLNDYVKDDDNMPLDMQFSVQTPADFPAKLTVDGHRLKVEAGSRKGTFTFTLVVLSNGVRAEKEMKLNVG